MGNNIMLTPGPGMHARFMTCGVSSVREHGNSGHSPSLHKIETSPKYVHARSYIKVTLRIAELSEAVS